MDPVTTAARAAISGIKEGLAVGKELEELTKEIGQLGKADLSARQAYRRKQAVRKPDTHFFEAVEEWKRFREIHDMRQEMLDEVKRNYSQKAVDDIISIEKRMKQDWEKIYNEDGHDRKKLFMLKVYCFGLAAIIVAILYINGIIRQMSEAL
jgi:uncharacterized protein YpuA (DUF1002 family)